MDDTDFPEPPKNLKGYIQQFKEMRTTFSWIWKYVVLSSARRWIIKLSITMMSKSLFEMMLPWIIGMIMKNVLHPNGRVLLEYLIALALDLLVLTFLGYQNHKAREWIFGIVFQSLDDQITKLFFEKSIGQHIQEGSELSIGNLEKGRGRVWELTFTIAFEAIPVTCSFLASFVALWVLSPAIGSIATGAITIFVLWLLWLNAQTMISCVPIERDFRKLNRYRLERWEHTERVKIRNQVKPELKEMDRQFTDVIGRDRSFWLWFGRQIACREVTMALATLLMIGYAILQSRQGIWSVTMLFPIFAWSMRLTNCLDQLGHIERRISWAVPSIQSMIRAITTSPDVDECHHGHDAANESVMRIEFVNLSHAFPERRLKKGVLSRPSGNGKEKEENVEILRDVSFSIEPGEKVALLGQSGAGKTTLMRLLLRAMDPTGGSIKLNGRDIREVSLPTLLDRIAYIPQHPRVFDGTIRYNLTYGLNHPPSDEVLRELLAQLKLDDSKRFVDGLDTLVGKNGVKLSGGQLQRLIIGAAIAQRPDLLVIDEATSHLDSTTEKEVLQEGLSRALTSNVSALIIAHRLSTVENVCTKYVVLRQLSEVKEGESQIEAIGSSFRELHEISSVFRNLADDQHLIIRAA